MQLLEFTESKKINIDRFVIGLPLLLSGNESSMSHLVKQFGKILQDRSGKEVIFYDERLTSSEIDNLMKTSEINRKKRKDCIDELVATLILQTYLNQL
jgi:putative Holliday junction resolvase